MSTVLHPVGPNPPGVYWLRRVLVLALVAVVVAGVLALVWTVAFRDGVGSGDQTGADGAPAVDGATSQDVAADAPAVPVDCVPASLQLAVVADAAQYASGSNPVLHVSVTNIGTVPCTVDAGDVTREVVISSGTDRIWSTKDCASPDTASRQLLLDAGARDVADISWARNRTAEGCPADLPAPRAGTYQAVGTVLGLVSEPAVFALQ